METPLPPEAMPLFRQRPEGFIAARDELVRRLRDDDRPRDAAAVKAMRKPTVVTWVLNQLATADPDGVAALLSAGADVRAVQRAALSSSKEAGTRLRTATAARRSAVTRLTDSARGLLEEAGTASATHVDAIRRALEAASTDSDAGEQLNTGTFARPPADAAGFGDLAGLTIVPPAAPDEADDGSAPARKPAKAPADDASSDQLVRAERTRLRRDRDAAVREARRARGSADRYAQELAAMRRRIAVVEEKHRAAEADASRKELDAARAERAFADVDGPS